MKQTNNAIKFLMAQYRAIFQNAYFKGLATAAVVTMGLAAGQAQAVDATGLAGATLEMSASATTAIADSGAKEWNAAVNVSGINNSTAHSIKAGTSPLTLSGNGSLTVKTGAADEAISLEAVASQGLTVKINQIDVQSGLVNIKSAASDAAATIEANKITVSGENAKISLTAAASAGVATLGRAAADGTAASLITLSNGGTIAFAGNTNASDAVLKGKLAGNGGKLDFGTNKGQVEAYGTVEKLDISVGLAGEGVIKLANVDGTKDDESVLTINSGTISIIGATGKLQVAGGTLDLGEGVRATAATTAGGTIDVNTGVLKLSKDQLVSFLSADGSTPDVKGKLAIGAKGEVFLKSSNPVDLSGLEFGTEEGKINVTAQGTIAADNLNISTAVKGATGLVLKAEDTLVAGSDSFESAKGGLGATLKAKKLTLKAKEDVFTLQDDVVLNSYQKTKKDNKDILSATSGELKSNAINISGGSVEVAAGNYDFGENITISDGQLKVTSAVDNLNSGVVASSLKLSNGDIAIVNEADNGITVSGAKAHLDITEAGSLTVTKTTGTEKDIEILLNAGELSLKGEQVLSFMDTTTNQATEAASFALKGDAKLHVVDELTLDKSQLISGTVRTASTRIN